MILKPFGGELIRQGIGGAHGHGMYGMHGGFGPIGLIVLALLIVVIVYIFMKRKKSTSSVDAEILEVLKRRYVEGEITEEEFIQKRDVLTNKKKL